MPIFVVLSGYTYKVRMDKSKLVPATIKDVKRLLGPVLITFIIEIGLRFVMGNVFTLDALKEILRVRLTAMFWASGIGVHDSAALGSIWFLISLFWVRLIVRLITTFLSFHKSIFLMFGLSIIGVLLGDIYYLPQNFDVVLAMLFFFAIGMLWNKYYVQIQKFEIPLLLVSLGLLSVCIYKGVYIELASRSYPYGWICFVEALAGSFLCVKVAAFLTKSKRVNTGLQVLGRETLMILCIHYLDKFFQPFWLRDNIVVSCIYRMIFDLGVFGIIILVRWAWKKLGVSDEKTKN